MLVFPKIGFFSYKSKDLRKLQQNLFYKQPECFVNDQIQKNNNGNLRFLYRLPPNFLNCHPCFVASLAVTGRDNLFRYHCPTFIIDSAIRYLGRGNDIIAYGTMHMPSSSNV